MTPCALSCPVEGLSWLEALPPGEADVFVTPPMPGVPASGLAGLWPVARWRPGPDGGLEELKAFLFDTPGPALGYLSYHAGYRTLKLDLPRPDFPEGLFRKYRVILSPSPDARQVNVHARDPADAREAARIIAGHRPAPAVLPAFRTPVRASLDAGGYHQAVRRALEHILDGDVYQVNLSIRFDTHWPAKASPQALFSRLLASRPAMFYALYHDSPYAILSTSPERFLRVRDGRVLSQPIKGTLASGPDRAAGARALLGSAKEEAELSMIVDLIRNDVSHHCRYGSVAVEGHRSLFEVDGLLQAYSGVTGILKEGSTCLDLLWDALPPGSVTGCPKRRAVEVIAGLEPHARDAYCGCLVLVHGPRDMDSSVAIRTAVVDQSASLMSFHAGSGIVVDSIPEMEYAETLAKAAKFLALTGRDGR